MTSLAEQKVLVTGASGLIGSALTARLLSLGATVVGLSRNAAKHRKYHPQITWISSLAELKEPVDIIYNLAGESIGAGRWTSERKAQIWDSRIKLTESLLDTCKRLPRPPATLVNASAIGVYGPQGPRPVAEDTEATTEGFGVRMCQAWEHSAQAFNELGTRVVITRFGVVLARHAPAWKQLTMSLHGKCATYMGSGKQMFSWVYLDDLVNALVFLASHEEHAGAFNVTAPEPLSQKAMAELFCKRGYAWFKAPVPAPAVKAMFGEMGEELLLSGQAVVPKRLNETEFTFKKPDLASALENLL